MGDNEKGMFNFAKLKGQDNWKQWCRNMEYALADCLLLSHVTGKSTRPSLSNPSTTSEVEKQEKWDEKDLRAAAKLGAKCSPEMQQVLDGTEGKTAKEKYDVLKKRCTASGLAAKWSAITKLSSITYGGSKNIQDMATQIKSAHIELKDLDVKVEDVVLLSLIINLGPEWSQYRTVLTERARISDKIDFDDIVKGLEDHERTMKNDEVSVNSMKNHKGGSRGGSKGDFKGDSSGGNTKNTFTPGKCDCCGSTKHRRTVRKRIRLATTVVKQGI